jgi:hypothetical protein
VLAWLLRNLVGYSREAGEEDHSKAIVGQYLVADLIHGEWLRQSDLWVYAMHRCRDASGHRRRVFRSAYCDTGAGPGDLPEGYVDLGIVFAETATVSALAVASA